MPHSNQSRGWIDRGADGSLRARNALPIWDLPLIALLGVLLASFFSSAAKATPLSVFTFDENEICAGSLNPASCVADYHGGLSGPATIVRDGITMVVDSEDGTWLGIGGAKPGKLWWGNVESSFTPHGVPMPPYVSDFSTTLAHVEVSLEDAFWEDRVAGQEAFVFLEAYSGAGATGSLLGRVTEASGDLTTLVLTGTGIMSIRYGLDIEQEPPLSADCYIGACNTALISSISVSTVPEPSTALLMGLGLTALGSRRRTKK